MSVRATAQVTTSIIKERHMPSIGSIEQTERGLIVQDMTTQMKNAGASEADAAKAAQFLEALLKANPTRSAKDLGSDFSAHIEQYKAIKNEKVVLVSELVADVQDARLDAMTTAQLSSARIQDVDKGTKAEKKANEASNASLKVSNDRAYNQSLLLGVAITSYNFTQRNTLTLRINTLDQQISALEMQIKFTGATGQTLQTLNALKAERAKLVAQLNSLKP